MNGGPMNDGPLNSAGSEVEQQLRAASQSLLERFPDSQVAPLRLPAQPAGVRARISTGRQVWRRGRPWLIPLAAAVAVLLVITLPMALSRGLGTSRAHAAPTGPEGTPPYYAQLADNASKLYGKYRSVEIRSTATGRILASVKVPRPYTSIKDVSNPTADDLTFVVSVVSGPATDSLPVHFLRLTFDPSSRTARLASLPIKAVPGTVRFALSPDGHELALSFLSQPLKITVCSLVTGDSRSWTGPRNMALPNEAPQSLTWLQNNKVLTFTWGYKGRNEQYLSQLNTAAPGTRLPTATTAPLPDASSAGATTTSGGVTLIANGLVIRKYLEVSGQLKAVPSGLNGSRLLQILWANPTGSVLIALSGATPRVGVLTHNGFRSLPGNEQSTLTDFW